MKPLKGLIVALVAVMVAAVPVTATQPQQKLPICHRTASETNPWVIIKPDSASWYAHLDNHVNHTPKNGRKDKFAIQWKDGSWHCAQEPVTPPPNEPPPNEPPPNEPPPNEPPPQSPPRTLTPPPEPTTGTIRVTGYVCGDPRVVIRSRSTWETKHPLRIRVVSAKTGKAKFVTRMTRPGFKRYDRFWAKGNTVFKVWDGRSGELLWKTRTGRDTNVGACPR